MGAGKYSQERRAAQMLTGDPNGTRYRPDSPGPAVATNFMPPTAFKPSIDNQHGHLMLSVQAIFCETNRGFSMSGSCLDSLKIALFVVMH